MLQVIGAGLPRTGTTSLKGALELLLDGPCYHMFEFFPRKEEHGAAWWQAYDGDPSALDPVLAEWVAAVDWPASVCWQALAERHPDALIVLSHRGDAETWWRSADRSVWEVMRRAEANAAEEPVIAAWNNKMRTTAGFGDDWDDPAAAQAVYRRHYDNVIASAPADRLLVWQPEDGWEPLCEALGVDVPDQPFLHRNTGDEFRRRLDEGTATEASTEHADQRQSES